MLFNEVRHIELPYLCMTNIANLCVSFYCMTGNACHACVEIRQYLWLLSACWITRYDIHTSLSHYNDLHDAIYLSISLRIMTNDVPFKCSLERLFETSNQ